MLSKKVKEEWITWTNQTPIYGFNSGKYDLNLIKEDLVKRFKTMANKEEKKEKKKESSKGRKLLHVFHKKKIQNS